MGTLLNVCVCRKALRDEWICVRFSFPNFHFFWVLLRTLGCQLVVTIFFLSISSEFTLLLSLFSDYLDILENAKS